MALFGRNPNETAFVGGKKHFTDIIKNSGPGDAMIWRQPEEDFNTNSTLIVMPGEQAIFVKGGTIEQVFDNGTYKLSTENYPFISRLRNALSGGISAFNCVVYFVKASHSQEIRWGTSSPIQVRDKMLGIATKIRANGAYKIQIESPEKFLTKLVGSNTTTVYQQEILDRYFSNEFQGKIKVAITNTLNRMNDELLGIEGRMEEIAEGVTPELAEVFSDYGLHLVKFSIAGMQIDDDELRRRYDEIGMDAIAKMRNAQADKNVMGILGDDWAKQQSVNILGTLASNPGGGGAAAAAGAGMGMGMGAAGAFGAMAQAIFQPTMNQNQPQQPVMQQPSGRFTQVGAAQQTVQQPSAPAEDPIQALEKLKIMLDKGLIPQQVYDQKMNEILSRM